MCTSLRVASALRPATGKQARKGQHSRHERGRHAQTHSVSHVAHLPCIARSDAAARPARRRAGQSPQGPPRRLPQRPLRHLPQGPVFRNACLGALLLFPLLQLLPGLGDQPDGALLRHRGAMLEAAVAGRAHLVQDPAVQVQRRQGGKPAVLVQQAHVALHGKVELFGAPRKRLPCRAKRRVHPMLGQLAQRIARFFQHARRQIHPTAAPVLPHVAQDVGQLHGHAQRHGVLAQPLRQRGMHVQERQQHEPDRPCHVVGVLFQVVQGGRLPEPQVATLPFQKVVERLRIHVEVLEHHGQGAPQRLVGHASCQEAVERPLAARRARLRSRRGPRSRPPTGRTRTARTRPRACAREAARTPGRSCASCA